MTLPLFGTESLYRYKDIKNAVELEKVTEALNVKDMTRDEVVTEVEQHLIAALDTVQFIGSLVEPIIYKYTGKGWFKPAVWQPFANERILGRYSRAIYVPYENDNLVIGGQPFQAVQTKADYDAGYMKGLNIPNKFRFDHFVKTMVPVETLYDLGFYEAGEKIFGD